MLQYSVDGGLAPFCQARSYSSPAEPYWHDIPGTLNVGEWHRFTIQVEPTEVGWRYAFRLFLDGEEVGYYQPPELWDGDNRYQVLWQGVQIGFGGQNNPDPEHPLRVLIDNCSGHVYPTLRP